MNEVAVQQHTISNMDIDKVERFANLMANARISIPAELQKNPGDCLAVCIQAEAWGMSPFAVAQKTHVIKGKLGYEAQLVNAVICNSRQLASRPLFTWSDGFEKIIGKTKKAQGKNGEYLKGDWSENDEVGLWCEVSAVVVGETEPRVLRLHMSQCHPRQSTLWATDPKQQLAYAVIKRWARLYVPDIVLGVYTDDELRTLPEKDITPTQTLKDILHGDTLTVRTESDPPAGRPETGQYIEDEQENTTSVGNNAPVDVVVDKGEQMKQRVRETMRANGQVVDCAPTADDENTLKMALECIQSSRNMEELEEAGKTLDGVLHPDHQGQVREVYRKVKEGLTA